ncbi:MAG: MFS transporter [Dehalococcoidia bacterium]|nr:MFS transporter [Dehalococcoidia bacterium]MDW8120379.1 MFS transporter [Chloroflexota bacterium]
MQVARAVGRRLPVFYGWVVVGAAGSTMFVRNAAASLTLAVFVYPMAADLGWSRTLIAGAASLGGILATAASPLSGWAVDRYGPRRVLLGSVVVLGLSTLALGWASTPLVFYLAYAVGRVLFSSPIQIGASVAVSQWFIRLRGRANAFLFLAHALGMGLFPLIAQGLMALGGGEAWRQAWVGLGLLVWGVAVLPVALLLVGKPEEMGLAPDGSTPPTPGGPKPFPPAPPDTSFTTAQALRTPALWLLALAGGLLFCVHAGVNIHQGAYLRDKGLAASMAAFAIAVNAACTGGGSLVWGFLSERLPVRWLYVATAGTIALASVLFAQVNTVAEAFGVTALFGFGLGGMLVLPSVAYANYFGRRFLGSIRGLAEPFVAGGQAVGALLAGAIFDATGSYQTAFLLYAGTGLTAALLLVGARPPTPPQVAPPPRP